MKRSASLCATLLTAVALLAPGIAPQGTRAEPHRRAGAVEATVAVQSGANADSPAQPAGMDSPAHPAGMDSPAHPARPVPTVAIHIGFVDDGGDMRVLRVKIRTAPRLDGKVVGRLPVGAPLRIYARVIGDAATTSDTRWYRISPSALPGRYIYSSYVLPFTAHVPERGKAIVVSLRDQWLLAFQNGHLILDSPVTTGRPELPTPLGSYSVMAKYAPYRMISPWPASSPFYYPVTTVRYALRFRADGYFIHDAGWRRAFGPGTDLPHRDPNDPFGSHGCVNVPTPIGRALFRWADIGTTIQIVP